MASLEVEEGVVIDANATVLGDDTIVGANSLNGAQRVADAECSAAYTGHDREALAEVPRGFVTVAEVVRLSPNGI